MVDIVETDCTVYDKTYDNEVYMSIEEVEKLLKEGKQYTHRERINALKVLLKQVKEDN